MAEKVWLTLKSTLSYAVAVDEHSIRIPPISSGSGRDSLLRRAFPRLKHPSCLEAFGAKLCSPQQGTAPAGFNPQHCLSQACQGFLPHGSTTTSPHPPEPTGGTCLWSSGPPTGLRDNGPAATCATCCF